MLWSMAFNQVGVVVGDIYFRDPDPLPGQDSAERGVRIELRYFAREALRGSIYSAVPISIGEPIWRVDLLGSVDSPHGSLDRAHHHPRFREWEPGERVFVPALSANPVQWLRDQFARIDGVLHEAGCEPETIDAADVEALRDAGPAVAAIVEHLFNEIASGNAAQAPATDGASLRESWL